MTREEKQQYAKKILSNKREPPIELGGKYGIGWFCSIGNLFSGIEPKFVCYKNVRVAIKHYLKYLESLDYTAVEGRMMVIKKHEEFGLHVCGFTSEYKDYSVLEE